MKNFYNQQKQSIKKIIFIFFIILICNPFLFAQSNHPKREFRAAWIATVINLDWPSSPFLSTSVQKQQLIDILDGLKETGINAVVFQIRSESDAMYESSIEPWSYWLTGQQGKAPNPFYDPLKFAVEEAHKRGMEIHAWFNPYRVVRDINGAYPVASNHVSVQHPDWIVRYSNIKVLNPGLPQVRDYITEVISDVVRRYDIDGVHFDDYFYPYPVSGVAFDDNAAFLQYPNGISNKSDWRRNNVNLFIKEVEDSIQAIKPWVKFGISPFGIWKSGVPTGITGLSSYNDLYADCMNWMRNHYVDYLTPQLYWPFGGGQDYGKLMPWYADSAAKYNRHFYPGQAAYRIPSWSASEVPNQIRANRQNPNTKGSVFFRALVGVLDNVKGFTDSLKNDLYKYPALLPIMNWKDTVKPNPPLNLAFGKIASAGRSGLIWDIPNSASDGDTANRYVVYHFNNPTPQPADYENAENIYSIEGSRESFPSSSNLSAPYYFSVTSLDRNYNESSPSNIVQITSPSIPVLADPFNNDINIKDTIELKWMYADGATSYQLEVSTDSTFDGSLLFNSKNLTDTVQLIAGMQGQTKYYWRVKSFNIAGESDYSSINNFTTGFPVMPALLDPPHTTLDVSTSPTLTWAKTPTAESYRFQYTLNSLTFNDQTVLLDSSGITDTSISLTDLDSYTIYFWRVSAQNEYGSSLWPTAFGFRTEKVVGVEDKNEIPTSYNLYQNYPNPFNPNTEIKFALPHSSNVQLKIFDILGREVAELVNENYSAGSYTVSWNGKNNSGIEVPSGIYIYTIRANEFSSSKKMMLLK